MCWISGRKRGLGWVCLMAFLNWMTLCVRGSIRAVIKVPEGAVPGPMVLAQGLSPPYYTGDSVKTFLSICPGGCSGNISECSEVLMVPGIGNCTWEDELYVKDLKTAQAFVREYQTNGLESGIISYVKISLMVLIFILGAFLLAGKHFYWKTLCSSKVPDHTYGIPLWEYKMMEFTTASVEDTRPLNLRLEEQFKKVEYYRKEKEIMDDFQRKLDQMKKKENMGRKSTVRINSTA